MVEIYNRMMRPAVARTAETYDFATDKVLTSRDIGGVHCVFLTVWPDSMARAWMETNLARVSPSTPVLLFTHDQPDVESKHLRNPNGARDINATDRFENLLTDTFADGPSVSAPSLVEQSALEAFLRRHPNIVGYFHGNSNANEFHDWSGPNHTIAVHVFRVDSPMKGAISSKDETKLSFMVVTIDVASRRLTARECLWNADPAHPASPVVWGTSRTMTWAFR